MRIDATLVDPLRNLPAGSFGGPAVDVDDPRANLAFRNLTRAQLVELLDDRGVAVTALTAEQILEGSNVS